MTKFKTKNSLFLLLIIAIILLLFIPAPFGLTVKGWQAVVLFLGFMVSCMANLAPMGTLSLTVLTAVGLLNLTPDSKSLFGVFGSESIWLVIFAFFIAIGFRNTGLGKRIAYQLIKFMGRSVNLLGYSLILCDLLVAPCIPSSNARGAGIGYPISTSMIDSLDVADPEKNVGLLHT